MQIEKTYKLKIKEGQTIEITEEQARSLFNSLKSIFGTKDSCSKDNLDWQDILKRHLDYQPKKDNPPYTWPRPWESPWTCYVASVKID